MSLVETAHQLNIHAVIPQLKVRGLNIIDFKKEDFPTAEGYPAYGYLIYLQGKNGKLPIRVDERIIPGIKDELIIWNVLGQCSPGYQSPATLYRLNTLWRKENPQSHFRLAVNKKGVLIFGVCRSKNEINSEALTLLISELADSLPKIQQVVKPVTV